MRRRRPATVDKARHKEQMAIGRLRSSLRQAVFMHGFVLKRGAFPAAHIRDFTGVEADQAECKRDSGTKLATRTVNWRSVALHDGLVRAVGGFTRGWLGIGQEAEHHGARAGRGVGGPRR